MRFGADYNPVDFEAQNTYYPAQTTTGADPGGVPYYLAPNAPVPDSGGSWTKTAVIDDQTKTNFNSSTPSNSMVPVDTNASSDWFGGALDKGKSLFTGLIDIWGRPAQSPTAPVPPSSSTPLWVWIALPVAGVITLGLAARMLRSKKRYAGYRRGRRSKR